MCHEIFSIFVIERYVSQHGNYVGNIGGPHSKSEKTISKLDGVEKVTHISHIIISTFMCAEAPFKGYYCCSNKVTLKLGDPVSHRL